MTWSVRRDEEGLIEWERRDGLATIRRRRRGGGDGYVVRIDVLEQAPEGRTYRRKTVESEGDADEHVDRWRSEFALEE
ncbi:hypothetical protein ACFQAS_04400 [Halopenitus salinus]|jgi:hypothetical protein|uniref:Uncharacterized protein n=1 Tax=Halopenitus salinus TaxID=1198295 RepID=A0ABD5V2N6_9EURY